MQPEADPVAHALLLSLPNNAVIRGGHTASRLGADDWQDYGLSAAGSQIKASHAIGNWRRERLVDHDATAVLRVFEGEDRAVWQEAN
jgi:hypothetical protein